MFSSCRMSCFFLDETCLGVKHHFLVASLIEKSTVCSHVRSPQRSGNKKLGGFFSMWMGLGWDGIGLYFLKETITTMCTFFVEFFLVSNDEIEDGDDPNIFITYEDGDDPNIFITYEDGDDPNIFITYEDGDDPNISITYDLILFSNYLTPQAILLFCFGGGFAWLVTKWGPPLNPSKLSGLWDVASTWWNDSQEMFCEWRGNQWSSSSSGM